MHAADLLPINDAPVLPVEDDPTPDTTAVSYEDAVASLRDAFDEALSKSLDGINSSTLLGDPAPYEGNGIAYDKFLSNLDALRYAEPTVDEQA